MSMELGTSNAYLVQPRHIWFSMLATRERKLALACAVISTVAVVFLISTIAIASRARFEPDCADYQDKICKTDACLNTVYQLRLYMDERKKPCEDFYGFACGNFPKIHKGYRNNLQVIQTQLYEEANKLLREPQADPISLGATTEARQLYQQCLDQENNNAEGLKYLRNMLKDVLQVDLPMVVGEKWNGQGFDWRSSTLKLLKGWSQNYILPFQILPSITDSTKYIPQLMRSTGEADYIFTEVVFNASVIKSVICTLYSKCTDDQASQQDIISLSGSPSQINDTERSSEKELNGFRKEENSPWFVLNADPAKQPAFQEYEIREIQRKVPHVDWKNFIEYLLGHSVDETFKVGTNLTDLNRAVTFLDKLENRTAANLIGWIFIAHWGKLFSPQLRHNLEPDFTQENLCFSFLNQVMGFAVGKLYVDKYISSDTIEEVENMTTALKESFKELVLEAGWMDEETRSTALRKVENMKSSVGMPPWALREDKLNEYYEEIKNVKDQPFHKSFRMTKDHYFKHQLQRLNRRVDILNDWLVSSPVATNAFYYMLSNAMFYYIGVIREPFYTTGSPRAVRFGSFGTVAGHEITHGFDSRGKDRDETGIERNWWSTESSRAYQQKAQCYVEFYSNITDNATQLKLDGKRTLSENIADSGGLRAAFKAFKLSPDEKTQRLKGLESYTEEQLFFISAAQIWCSDQNVFSLAKTITSEVHSPSKYRAVVPFQNDPVFSKAFKCDENSPMNPRTKCQLW